MVKIKNADKDDAIIDEVLADAESDSNMITAMAQKAGSSGDFTFYTLDNEQESHSPHVHVCVPIDAKGYKGAKNLKSGNPYKTIFAIVLNPDKDFVYTADNIEIEYSCIGDCTKDSIPRKILKICADWLNSVDRRLNSRHAIICLVDYIESNGVGFYADKYKEWL